MWKTTADIKQNPANLHKGLTAARQPVNGLGLFVKAHYRNLLLTSDEQSKPARLLWLESSLSSTYSIFSIRCYIYQENRNLFTYLAHIPQCSYSAIFYWETLVPVIHVDVTWHKLSGQTPWQIKHNPLGTSMTLVLQQDNMCCHNTKRNTLRNLTRS